LRISPRDSFASIYGLKPRFQSLLRPVAARLVAVGATANGVTLFALGGSIVVGVAIGFAGAQRLLLLLAPLWLLVRMALNAIDGIMAREFSQKSSLGAFLNELGDVGSDVALYLPLGIAFSEVSVPVVAFSIGAVLTEFCGLLGLALGGSRRYDGPMGKSDRAFVFAVLTLAIALSTDMVTLSRWVLWAAVALEVVTCANRVRSGLGEIDSGERGGVEQ